MLEHLRGTGLGLLASFHDLNLAAAFCDRLYVLDAGRIVAQGTPEQVLTEHRLAQVFGVRALVDRHPLAPHPRITGSPRMKRRLTHLALLAALPFAAWADSYPVTVRSCERDITFTQAPQRAVSHDINLTGMLLALGLRERMVGYSGVSGWKTLDPSLREALTGLPELAPRYPSPENLLDAQADFLFAGWGYGMNVGGPLTPQTLAPLGIPVYELSESCSWIMPRRQASLEDLYQTCSTWGASSTFNRGPTCLSSICSSALRRSTRNWPQCNTNPASFSTTAAKTAPPLLADSACPRHCLRPLVPTT